MKITLKVFPGMDELDKYYEVKRMISTIQNFITEFKKSFFLQVYSKII